MVTIDQKIVEYFENNLNIEGWPLGNLLLCVIALFLCVILVGLIGVEREKRGRSAGLRTHLLVGVGSTIIMIISIYGFPQIFKDHRDVARLAAQIITGVGFLGAGAIIHSSSGIKGLTTAGTIWASMAIGLACGSFNFVLALGGTLLIILVLTVFKKFEARLTKKSPTFILTVSVDQPVLNKIIEVGHKNKCTINNVFTSKVEDSNPALLEICFQANFYEKDGDITKLMSDLEEEIKPASINLLSHL